MKTTQVVIGAGFGDEGKGQTVHSLVDQIADHNDTCVVRFNGGAQAGHTVVHNDIRHVFSHFGSGSLQGVKTYLSRDFILNPVLFADEHARLIKHVTPIVSAHPKCRLTTVYDMMYNRWLEKKLNHGSCGVGINATVDRHEIIPITLESDIHTCMNKIIEYYEDLTKSFDITSYVDSCVYDRFVDEYEFMKQMISQTDEINENHIVFEGAQGLLLDEVHGTFPHVTRSRTGMDNLRADPMFNKMNFEIFYVTRAYASRHGNGPFWEEDMSRYFDIVDNTNIHNQWQGSIRFGRINFKELLTAINRDHQNEDACMVITCMDQHKKDALYPVINEDGVRTNLTYSQFMHKVKTLARNNKLRYRFSCLNETDSVYF